MTRELTYEPEPGETLRHDLGPTTFVPDTNWTMRPEEIAHDVMTCHHPVCRETRRIILARRNGLRK